MFSKYVFRPNCSNSRRVLLKVFGGGTSGMRIGFDNKVLLFFFFKIIITKKFFFRLTFLDCSSKCSTSKYSTSISHGEKSFSEKIEYLQRNGFRFGQPTHYSHPHLLKPDELTVGLLPSEFASRRNRLMEKIFERCQSYDQNYRNIVIIHQIL